MQNEIIRMCVQSRNKYPREQMLRLVVSGDNVVLDNSYQVQGRSIYILADDDIIQKFLSRKKLPLRVEVNKKTQIREILGDYLNEK